MKSNPLKRVRPWMWVLGAIAVLLAAIFILMNLDFTPPKTTVVATGKIDGDFEYTLYSDNTAEITKYLGSAAAVTVPAKVGGATVTSLGTDEAEPFRDNEKLTSVTVSEGIQKIGAAAFSGCKKLTSVSLPESVTEIGSSAFYLCYDLPAITLPSALTKLGGSAFSYCKSLVSVNVPTGVDRIGSRTFDGCTALSSIRLEKVVNIDQAAFAGCTSLSEVYVGAGISVIGKEAFSGCTSLSSFTLGTGEQLSIGASAFKNCSSLTEIAFPSGMRMIDASAFNGCTSLAKVRLYCEDVTVDRESQDELFRDCPLTEMVLGEGVIWVPSYFFYGCEGLTEITIPLNVTAIGAGAFRGCTGITYVKLHDKIAEIQPVAFAECTSLAKVDFYAKEALLGYSLSLGGGAFEDCPALTEFFVAEGVEALSDNFLYGNISVTNLSLPSTLKFAGNRALLGTGWLSSRTEEFVVVGGTLLKYNGTATAVTLPAGVTAIGADAFRGNETVTSVNLSDEILAIYDNAFRGCTALDVAIPQKLLTLGAYAFADSGITVAAIPEGIEELPESVFAGCAKLSSVTFPKTLAVIGASAFNGCTALKKVTIPATVTSIKENAFFGSAKEVLLGMGITAFTQNSFSPSEASPEEVKIFFTGTASSYIDLGKTENLISATVYTYLTTAPKNEGNYWHYGEGDEILIWETAKA